MWILRALVLAVLGLVAISSTPVQAQSVTTLSYVKPKPVTRGVPEISAVGLGGVAVLLVGGVLLFGARRNRRRSTS